MMGISDVCVCVCPRKRCDSYLSIESRTSHFMTFFLIPSQRQKKKRDTREVSRQMKTCFTSFDWPFLDKFFSLSRADVFVEKQVFLPFFPYQAVWRLSITKTTLLISNIGLDNFKIKKNGLNCRRHIKKVRVPIQTSRLTATDTLMIVAGHRNTSSTVIMLGFKSSISRAPCNWNQ